MIIIIDYDVGNIRSIKNAFDTYEIDTKVSRDHKDIRSASGIVLPGVGSFPHAMEKLNSYGLSLLIKELSNTGIPILGICLGMQLLLTSSDEFENTSGLNIIPGHVRKLPKNVKEKLPFVTWAGINKKNSSWDHTILKGIESNEDMYFVHSYFVQPDEINNVLSVTDYFSFEYCSSIQKDNVYGCQFHPEKSGKPGLKIIENFIEICKEHKNAK